MAEKIEQDEENEGKFMRQYKSMANKFLQKFDEVMRRLSKSEEFSSKTSSS